MPSNPRVNSSADLVVATDEVAGAQVQLVKVAFGTEAQAQRVTADAPLPVGDAVAIAQIAALKNVADTIATAAAAIQAAVEAINTKATAINTDAVAGIVAVSNLPATQPISGNVSVAGVVEIANDAGNAIPVSAAALPLPAGAATEVTTAELKNVADTIATAAAAIQAAVEALNTKTTAINTGAIAGTVALDAASLAALETINVGNFPAAPADSAPTNVAASIASVTILAANAARRGGVIYNDSTASLRLVANASAASPTNFTELLNPGESLVLEAGDYTGEIRGVWTGAVGYARVTEFT